MLFNITKQKSLAVLKLLAAIFILTAPSVIGHLPVGAGIYSMFFVTGAIFCIRATKTQKITLSANHIVYLLLGAYAIITSLWAGNKEGNLLYIFSIATVILFHLLSSDYFAECVQENIGRRMMYLICTSGVICSLVNVFYWLVKIVPVASDKPLGAGLGTNNFLAIFIFFSMFSTILLVKGNSRNRKVLLLLAIVLQLFVFLLARSVVAWFLAIIFLLVAAAKKKGEKTFVFSSAVGAVVFLLCATIMVSFTGYPTAFPDVFSYAMKRPFGMGGGFWSATGVFSDANYTATPHVGLLAYLFAAGGILGVVSCAFLMLRSLILFFRLKNMTAFAGLLLCIAVVILPFGANIAVMLLLTGLNAYNEQNSAMTYKMNLNSEIVKKVSYAGIVAIIISATLFSHSMIRLSAKKAYNNKDYINSYSLYKIAGTINVTDSESLRMAVVSLRKADEIPSNKDEAEKLIEKAIRRDRNNINNLHEKARLYDACEEFELSAQQYRDTVQEAFDKDKYNLLLVKELYKIVEKSPKGSAETKRAYEEILQVSQSTVKLDYKKEINDIADKAFKFTKGEFISEG